MLKFLKRIFNSNFGHKNWTLRVTRPLRGRFERKVAQFWPKPNRSFWHKTHCFRPKLYARECTFACTHLLRTLNTYVNACLRIKRLAITPRRGSKGAGKPKAERATTKRKAGTNPFGGWYRTPTGSGMSTPLGCSYVHRGTP